MDLQQLKADYILRRLISLDLKELLPLGSRYYSFLVVFLVTVSVILVLFIIRRIFLIRKSLREEPVFLEITPPAFTEINASTTEQLFSVIHNLGERKTLPDKLLGRKATFSFEIVSTLKDGIRYLVRTDPEEAANFKRSLISYLPQVGVRAAEDYLPADLDKQNGLYTQVSEFKLKRHFAYPLQKKDILKEHDPVAYITGVMTKLSPTELVSFQIVLSPTQKGETKLIKEKILHGEDVLAYLNRLIKLPGIPVLKTSGSQIKPHVFTRFQQEVVASIEEKIDQPLFETKIRVLVSVKNKKDLRERVKGFSSSLALFSIPGYQAICKKRLFFGRLLFLNFRKRLLSTIFNKSSDLLSVSEISALFHFPFTRVTQTENIVKLHSKDLPAPLSLKKGKELDVVFGFNSYGGKETDIGLTDETRDKHVYIIGATGSGKSTVIFNMAREDIQKGRGVAVVDPHGDLAEDLLSTVPNERINDFIYINPFDLKYPIGINLLELPEGLDEDELELEKELVCESVITIFRRVFTKEDNVDAHRIEYILRNTIYTAFIVPDRTIFKIYNLLNDPDYRKGVTATLEDENLKNFWKNEFGKAGNFQIVKMVSGVTAKVGRFLFSPTARRILEQQHSTINFDEILAQKKILICNLSEGKLGEDTSQILGMTIISKIQQAAQRRARQELSTRTPFYLYVDEFQNFATTAFTKILSGGRKFGLRITIAEQSTSQQKDKDIVNIILANVGTVICFRTAGLYDEQYMLNLFSPYVEKGEITNLARYTFYMKISAVEPEEPFSGKTLKIDIKKDPKKIQRLIEVSRKNYAIVYQKPEAVKDVPEQANEANKDRKTGEKSQSGHIVPKNRKSKL